MDVDIDARVVVHLAQLPALGQLRFALCIGRRRRRGRQLHWRILVLALASGAAVDAGIKLDHSAHQLSLTDSVVEQCLERFLGRVSHAAIAVGDAADAHAVEDGVGFGGGGQGAPRQGETGRSSSRAAEKRATGGESVHIHGKWETGLSVSSELAPAQTLESTLIIQSVDL